jgi:hypothetical protein
MAQLLFYENVAPVSPQRHGDLSIERIDYSFAAHVNSVPLTAVEMPAAAAEYTIVFAGNENAVTPVIIVGLEGTTNRYVDEEGKWSADYVPAFVRRYPFVFAQTGDETNKTFTLCLDENSAACNREGKGERLFDDKGERTEYLSRLLKFLEEYQAHIARTQTYCNNLRELGLLEPMKADFTFPGGEKKSLGGFMAVNRQKLKELPPEKLQQLAKTDELELTYIHLLSMNNFRRVLERSVGKPAATATTAPELETPEQEAPKE